MEIYGLQKVTLLDYPDKVACTVFTGGCNFLDIPSIGTMRSGVSVPTNPDLGSNGSGTEPL